MDLEWVKFLLSFARTHSYIRAGKIRFSGEQKSAPEHKFRRMLCASYIQCFSFSDSIITLDNTWHAWGGGGAGAVKIFSKVFAGEGGPKFLFWWGINFVVWAGVT